jgi:S-adenosylmethionine hydrolase
MSDLKLLTITSDFGVQTQGVGLMMAVAIEIAPDAKVIHLMHGLPSFDLRAGARTLEAIKYVAVGHHVCVCDPGVGTDRKAVVIETGRGDRFIGPDNGVLIPAARILGGIERAYIISNPTFMRPEVSPLFHGRDVFTPTAAHLSNGRDISEVGPEIQVDELRPAPYEEAQVGVGGVRAEVIQINHFGSLHLNVLHESWDSCEPELHSAIDVSLSNGQNIAAVYARTFGDVQKGKEVVLRDDYGRIEIACNLASFAERYNVRIGDSLELSWNANND